MNLIPWKRRNESAARPAFDDFDASVDALFDSFFGADRSLARVAEWTPSLDVKETKDELVVIADLPGMKKDEISLSVENGLLTVSGERREEASSDGEGWHRVERSYGSFSRSLRLPQGLEEGKVKAEYKDGVLRVSIPKGEGAKTRSITID